MKPYIMALDQGTTSSRCILFDKSGRIVSQAQREFTQIFPAPGYVEHDPMEIWSSEISVAMEAVTKIGATFRDIAAIGITNQRETTIVWDRKTGIPVYNAIVWQCRRTAEQCEDLARRGYTEVIRKKTGLLPDPYFSATKIAWILDSVEGARERAERGELCFGTVDSWLIYNLTGKRAHKTDVSNASRTMLFNIHTMDWDGELLDLFRIPRSMLPEVCPSSSLFGTTDPGLFGEELPIGGVAGDQQAALFGQCCFAPGEFKNTYGTGAFLLMNTGDTPKFCDTGLVTTVAWKIGNDVTYALEGSVFTCGAAIQWLRDGLRIIQSAKESEACALSVPDTAGVVVVPAFTGLGAPRWDPYARGVIMGLTRAATKEHLVRATLESMAYQTADVIDLMEKTTGMEITALKVDGGASANDFLMQFQADILAKPIERPACVETTALGAALLAGLAVGEYASLDEIRALYRTERRFSPEESDEYREKKMRLWHRALDRAQNWIDEET